MDRAWEYSGVRRDVRNRCAQNGRGPLGSGCAGLCSFVVRLLPPACRVPGRMRVDKLRTAALIRPHRNVWRSRKILAGGCVAFWCLHGSLPATQAEEDWPQFLGPHRNGTSGETGLLERWPAKGVPVAWEKRIGTGYSAPSVRGERLVLHHRVGEEEIIECLQAATGKPLWRHGYPS